MFIAKVFKTLKILRKWIPIMWILVHLSLQLPHAFFFIVAMKRNYNFSILPPFNYNPTSWLWQRLGSNGILKEKDFKFFEACWNLHLITLGIGEDEQTFSTLTYIKNKLNTYFIVHLHLVIKMYAQKLYHLATFPFYITI